MPTVWLSLPPIGDAALRRCRAQLIHPSKRVPFARHKQIHSRPAVADNKRHYCRVPPQQQPRLPLRRRPPASVTAPVTHFTDTIDVATIDVATINIGTIDVATIDVRTMEISAMEPTAT